MFMMKDMKGIMLATIAFLYLTNAYELMPDSVTTGIDNPTQYMPHAVDRKMARIFSSIAPNAMHKGVTDGQQALIQGKTSARGESWWYDNREESEWRTKATYTVKMGQSFRKFAPDDITMTIQGDISRMGRLNKLAERWNGPVSFACLCESKDVDTVKRTFEAARGVSHDNVALHIVASNEKWSHYPINYMRNVAIEGAPTHWIYVIDIDEDISGTMREHKNQLDRANAASTPETVFAVASFQWKGERSTVPRDWAELGQTFRNGDLSIKHAYYPAAYSLPGLSTGDFLKSENAVTLKPKESFEPYFLARKEGLPKFDTRFVGFRGNKAILFWRLQLAGWKVKALPGLFTFADETAKEMASGEVRLQKDTQDMALYESVIKELGMVYGCHDCGLMKNCFKRCPKTSGDISKPDPPAVNDVAVSASFMKANFGVNDPIAQQIVNDWAHKVAPQHAMPIAEKKQEGDLQDLSSPMPKLQATQAPTSDGSASSSPIAKMASITTASGSLTSDPPTKSSVQARNTMFKDMISAGFGTGLIEVDKGTSGNTRRILAEQRAAEGGSVDKGSGVASKNSIHEHVIADKKILERYLSKSVGTGSVLEPPL